MVNHDYFYVRGKSFDHTPDLHCGSQEGTATENCQMNDIEGFEGDFTAPLKPAEMKQCQNLIELQLAVSFAQVPLGRSHCPLTTGHW